jgi:hypothetical protein
VHPAHCRPERGPSGGPLLEVPDVVNAFRSTRSGRTLRLGAALRLSALALCLSCAPEPSDPDVIEEIPEPLSGSASFEEPWEANLLLRRQIPDEEAIALLRDHRARPYAVYGWTRWDHRVGTGPRSASESLLEGLRRGAIHRARSVLCDPDLRESEPPADPGEARRLLSDLIAAERLLKSLPAGEPIVYALRVTAPAGELRRLRDDPRVADLQLAKRVDGVPVLPEVHVPAKLSEPDLVPEVVRLTDAAVRLAIVRSIERAPCDR